MLCFIAFKYSIISSKENLLVKAETDRLISGSAVNASRGSDTQALNTVNAQLKMCDILQRHFIHSTEWVLQYLSNKQGEYN